MDDIRYSELKFLRALSSQSITYFNPNDTNQTKAVGLPHSLYADMAATLIEELHVRFERDDIQQLISRLRGEIQTPKRGVLIDQWEDPRKAVFMALIGPSLLRLNITYRGLRRIEELRELLRQDRILEHFGVLLDLRYFRPDLEDALQRNADTPICVIYADMDDFGKINKQFGQAAGDVVMKAYLEVIREDLSPFGTGYRGLGDETVALVIGQEKQQAIEIAETLGKRLAAMNCEYKGTPLPRVTASIGVATTPPSPRTMEIENLAEERKRRAKEAGKNRVIAES